MNGLGVNIKAIMVIFFLLFSRESNVLPLLAFLFLNDPSFYIGAVAAL